MGLVWVELVLPRGGQAVWVMACPFLLPGTWTLAVCLPWDCPASSLALRVRPTQGIQGRDGSWVLATASSPLLIQRALRKGRKVMIQEELKQLHCLASISLQVLHKTKAEFVDFVFVCLFFNQG